MFLKFNHNLVLIGFFLYCSIVSCKKYLDEKPSQKLAEPTSVSDLQALLDNVYAINTSTPGLSELLSDNVFITASYFQSNLNSSTKDDPSWNYIWDKDAYSTQSWQLPYQTVYYSNVVLNQLDKIHIVASEMAKYNSLKGSALFYRAFNFYQLAQLYCRPYSSTANADLGIVLRLTPAIEAPSERSTVKETYDQIIADLTVATNLLPETTLYPTRPNKAAAFGLLARVYLSMRDYVNAGLFANTCLQKVNLLLDYNTIPQSTSNTPLLNVYNPEIVYFNKTNIPSFLHYTIGIIDTVLYQSYDLNDLRKTVYFRYDGGPANYWHFKGSYDGNITPYGVFDGITTSEMYLIRAECFARAGDVSNAMSDLNALLSRRWKTGTFIPVSATNADDAKYKVLTERRKELVYRGLRWSDLRRFNLEDANYTLYRVITSTTYSLPPNDLRWVALIPWVEVNRSGIQQNPR